LKTLSLSPSQNSRERGNVHDVGGGKRVGAKSSFFNGGAEDALGPFIEDRRREGRRKRRKRAWERGWRRGFGAGGGKRRKV